MYSFEDKTNLFVWVGFGCISWSQPVYQPHIFNFSTFHFVAVVFCCSFCQDIEILFNANSLLLVIIINVSILIFTSLTYIKSRLSLHLCTNLNHDIFMQEN